MNFFGILVESDPELDPDPLVRDSDPDLHQNVTDPQHCFSAYLNLWTSIRIMSSKSYGSSPNSVMYLKFALNRFPDLHLFSLRASQCM
jgi:hypothetical protein